MKVDGSDVELPDYIAAKKIGSHFVPFFVSDNKIMFIHELLKAVICFGVHSGQFFKGFVVSVECKFAAP